MARLAIQPSINDARSQALLPLIERLGALDLTPLLIYRIASVPDSALPFLAWQFDILSPFWSLLTFGPVVPLTLLKLGDDEKSVDALTDIDTLVNVDTLSYEHSGSGNSSDPPSATDRQRAMIENAIALHRVRGTPAAIKRAIARLGWPRANLLEGQNSWGGTSYPANQGWAVFRVMIELAAGEPVDAGDAQLIAAAVDFFKPARAWLDSIWFVTPPMPDIAPVPVAILNAGGIAQIELDSAPAGDDSLAIHLTEAALADPYGPARPIYNAHFRHSGITYGADEPLVADSALQLGGLAVLQGG